MLGATAIGAEAYIICRYTDLRRGIDDIKHLETLEHAFLPAEK